MVHAPKHKFSTWVTGCMVFHRFLIFLYKFDYETFLSDSINFFSEFPHREEAITVGLTVRPKHGTNFFFSF